MFHGSRSYTEVAIENASCQMGGREIAGGEICIFLQENEWSRSYRRGTLGPMNFCTFSIERSLLGNAVVDRGYACNSGGFEGSGFQTPSKSPGSPKTLPTCIEI